MLLDGKYRTFKGFTHRDILYICNKSYIICNRIRPRSVIYKGYFFVHLIDDKFVSLRREVVESEIDYSENAFDEALKEVNEEQTTPRPNLEIISIFQIFNRRVCYISHTLRFSFVNNFNYKFVL